MSSSTIKYQLLSTIPDEAPDEESEIDLESQNQPSVDTVQPSRFLGLLLPSSSSGTSSRSSQGYDRLPISAPITPASSDGVFSNIPAKPTSSKDVDQDDEEMGADEWIFMTPEQRSKLPPPKYSKIKRDRAPKYTIAYTPPDFLPSGRNSNRPKRYKPRINSLPAGSSSLFVASAVISTLLPILGYCVLYFSNGAKWKSHSTKLGSRTGVGLSLFHVGAMLFYIPALLSPGSYLTPLIISLVWTLFIGMPCGWRIARNSSKKYALIKAQERTLIDQFVKANLAVDDGRFEYDEEEDDNGYTYIEGTDMRVRDLKMILSRARDARLARSLRAAGF